MKPLPYGEESAATWEALIFSIQAIHRDCTGTLFSYDQEVPNAGHTALDFFADEFSQPLVNPFSSSTSCPPSIDLRELHCIDVQHPCIPDGT